MVKVCICFTFGEDQLGEIFFDPGVPSMRCLFQYILRSLEFAQMRFFVEGLKSFWMLYIHVLLNHSIEETFLHIHFMYLPSHLC